MKEQLPHSRRAAILNVFLSSPRGLLPGETALQSPFNQNIIDYLLQRSSPRGRQVAQEVLRGFLYAQEATHIKTLQSRTLAYLLSVTGRDSSSGQSQRNPELLAIYTLKNLLESQGTIGVKLGQFLAASEMFSPEETEILRGLQEQANLPNREEVYQDLRRILNVDTVPYEILQTLGGASLKYAVLARRHIDGKLVVLKVRRDRAVHQSELQFRQLEKLVEYLIHHFGARYGVFRSIARAVRQAVEKELSFAEEVRRGVEAARAYAPFGHDDIPVHTPSERLINEDLIESDYAEGVSIHEIQDPEIKFRSAQRVLQVEERLMTQPMSVDGRQPRLGFCPDRHPGNIRF